MAATRAHNYRGHRHAAQVHTWWARQWRAECAIWATAVTVGGAWQGRRRR